MKKLFLIVMACALSFTALTGCGAGDVGGPGYQSSSQAAENQSQAAEGARRSIRDIRAALLISIPAGQGIQ